MNPRALAALEIWNTRRGRGRGDRGFAVYLVFMVALVTVVPFARLIWLSATSPSGIALLDAPAAPGVASFIVALLWAGALLVGRARGPAVLAPFLTRALATSDLRGADIYSRSLLRSGTLITTVTTTAAGTVAAALAQQGLVTPLDAVMFAAAGALAGVTATVLWLAGQVWPRVAAVAAPSILLLAVLALAVPAMLPVAPWGWGGYPTQLSPLALAALAVLALALISAAPTMLNRLRLTSLMTQAARWDSLIVHATGMDFASAVTLYQPHPRLGRRLRAVRPAGSLATTFFVRDAIGALRTPGRFIVGVGALVAAGMLLTFAFTPGAPVSLLGAAAGLVAFAGLGPLTDGLRHAASVAADFSPYGVSDEALVGYHLLFPLAVVVTVLLVISGILALVAGAAPVLTMVGAVLLGLSALGIRLGNALKGPLPTALLAPVSTPAGDPMAAVRLLWALDAVVLAALVGAAAATLPAIPLLIVGVAAAIIATVAVRWRARRQS